MKIVNKIITSTTPWEDVKKGAFFVKYLEEIDAGVIYQWHSLHDLANLCYTNLFSGEIKNYSNWNDLKNRSQVDEVYVLDVDLYVNGIL